MMKTRSNTNTPVQPSDASDAESVIKSFSIKFSFLFYFQFFFFMVRLNLPVAVHQAF